MSVSVKKMKEIEINTGFSVGEMVGIAANAIAEYLMKNEKKDKNFVFIAGKGNNGNDAIEAYKILKSKGYRVVISLVDREPGEDIDVSDIVDILDYPLDGNTVVIDGIYGFSYHGRLRNHVRAITQYLNQSRILIYSIDINSGACADTDEWDEDAIISDVTLALEKKKYFHDKAKEHGLFSECVVLPLGFDKEGISDTLAMNEKTFLKYYRARSETAYKGSEGKCMLVGGSYGMAGALGLNIIGAKSVGSSFIHVGIDDRIYPILASRFLTPVYHPLYRGMKLEKVDAISFGSGCTQLEDKSYWLHKVLESDIPCVIDAEGINLLQYDLDALKEVTKPVIITPHMMEFSRLSGLSMDEIKHHRIQTALQFAKEYQCIVVLKGVHTVVAGPKGELYINQSGNQGLAQAGSGDVLTGMITGLLAKVKDPFVSACMGVWFHGYLADMMSKNHSLVTLPLEQIDQYGDQFFKKYSR